MCYWCKKDCSKFIDRFKCFSHFMTVVIIMAFSLVFIIYIFSPIKNTFTLGLINQHRYITGDIEYIKKPLRLDFLNIFLGGSLGLILAKMAKLCKPPLSWFFHGLASMFSGISTKKYTPPPLSLPVYLG